MAARGVVLETGDGWAIVLLSNGEYKRVKTKKSLEVGELYNEKARFSFKYAVAAALFLVILLGTLDFFTVTAYARVSSGVELGLNRWDRVIYAKAVDDKGEELLQGINLKGQKVGKALEIIVDRSLDASQVSAERSRGLTMSVAVKSNNKEERKQELLLKIDNAMQRAFMQKKNNRKLQVIKEDNQVIVRSLDKEKNFEAGNNTRVKTDDGKSKRMKDIQNKTEHDRKGSLPEKNTKILNNIPVRNNTGVEELQQLHQDPRNKSRDGGNAEEEQHSIECRRKRM